MRIARVELINFKRFTKLTIENIDVSSKLVLIIGSNGSGKSSIFDAFGFFDALIKQDVPMNDDNIGYFRKNKNEHTSATLSFDNGNIYTVSTESLRRPALSPQSFYGRTSFRQVPRLTRTSLGQGGTFNLEKDSDRPRFFIERDDRFENDIEKITEIILTDLFRSKESNAQIRSKYIDPINRSLNNIFGEVDATRLQLIEIIPPLEGRVAQITFKKGNSEIHYNYLSAGEKEVFNLLINLLSRGSVYQNTVYYLDEIDLHLNTRLQFNLLREITENWIPQTSQLWCASHSLGFIEYAKQSEYASIIDFDELNFDLPQLISPSPKDNPDVYEIAVGKEFLSSLFRQLNIFFVENRDRDYYASIGISETVFVSDNNRNNVFYKVISTDYKGIVDRDFLSDDDIKQIGIHYPNLKVLKYYSIENYMYHPDNLEEYNQTKSLPFDKVKYTADLTAAKNREKNAIILQITLSRSGYPYFGAPEWAGKELQNRFRNKTENINQSSEIQGYLNSDNLEVYYKSLPMKTYCTGLPQRQNIPKSELAKTNWFKDQLTSIIT